MPTTPGMCYQGCQLDKQTGIQTSCCVRKYTYIQQPLFVDFLFLVLKHDRVLGLFQYVQIGLATLRAPRGGQDLVRALVAHSQQ